MTTPTAVVCYRDGTFTLPAGFDPPPDRLASPAGGDNLCEFAGRLCYNSVNRDQPGRSTDLFWENVLATGHHSVIAHVVDTLEVRFPSDAFYTDVLVALHCRPGVWVTRVGARRVRFAVSLRAVAEWADHGVACDDNVVAFRDDSKKALYYHLYLLLHERYPKALSRIPAPAGVPFNTAYVTVERVTPESPKEEWVSFYLAGVSRDLLGELVRHHWQCNPSVESTRYVDKSDVVFIEHPALADANMATARMVTRDAQVVSRRAYRKVLEVARAAGLDKKTCKDVARPCLLGAADTRLVFSLSKFQARHILKLRVSQATGMVNGEMHAAARAIEAALRVVWPDL